MEFDGKILLDAYKDIPDYPYGEQPPFGCRHVWVGVAKGLEINPDGPNEAVEHDFNFITTEDLNKKWSGNIVNEDQNKEFLNQYIDEVLSFFVNNNLPYTNNIEFSSNFFSKYGTNIFNPGSRH